MTKAYPTIGCCGIDCGLCPRYYTDGASRCPGCCGVGFEDMLPCFFFALYERDGLPFEKVLRNIARSMFLWPRTRPYQTDNFYAYLSNPRKEVQQIGTSKKSPARPKKRQA